MDKRPETDVIQEVSILENKPSHIVIPSQGCQICVTKPAQASGQEVLKTQHLSQWFFHTGTKTITLA